MFRMICRAALLVGCSGCCELPRLQELGRTSERKKDTPDLVQSLLTDPAERDSDHKSRFFKVLDELARRHGFQAGDYVSCCSWMSEGRAVLLEADSQTYIVCILRQTGGGHPGPRAQELLLLDDDGKLLDWISCTISSRLTSPLDGGGTFWTEVPGKPLDDGAQLIIRYAPRRDEDPTGWNHELTYDQLWYRFRWDEHGRSWDKWKRTGLCRIAVRDGKFHSLWPRLETPLPPDECPVCTVTPAPSLSLRHIAQLFFP